MIIQKILSHEVTKAIGIIAITFSLVKMVILPIQEIQIKLAQVQLDIEEMKSFKILIEANTTDIVRLQEALKRYNINVKN